MGRCYTVQRWKKKLQQSLQKVEPDSTCSNLSLFWPLQACSAYAVSSIYVWSEFFGSPIPQYAMKGLCVGHIWRTAVLLLFQTGEAKHGGQLSPKATSTRIRFHAKTETFLFVFAFRPHANAYSAFSKVSVFTRNGDFRKRV